MSGIVWLVPLSGIVAVIAATMLARDVLSRPKGTPEMQQVAGAIYEGAMAFLNRQYRTIGLLSVLAAVLIGALLGAISPAWKTVTPVTSTRSASSTVGAGSARPVPAASPIPQIPKKRSAEMRHFVGLRVI